MATQECNLETKILGLHEIYLMMSADSAAVAKNAQYYYYACHFPWFFFPCEERGKKWNSLSRNEENSRNLCTNFFTSFCLYSGCKPSIQMSSKVHFWDIMHQCHDYLWVQYMQLKHELSKMGFWWHLYFVWKIYK